MCICCLDSHPVCSFLQFAFRSFQAKNNVIVAKKNIHLRCHLHSYTDTFAQNVIGLRLSEYVWQAQVENEH